MAARIRFEGADGNRGASKADPAVRCSVFSIVLDGSRRNRGRYGLSLPGYPQQHRCRQAQGEAENRLG